MFVHQAPLTGKTFLDLGPVELGRVASGLTWQATQLRHSP
jgi:hypothetical protein